MFISAHLALYLYLYVPLYTPRDVKTTNVLIDHQCRAKLCDFSFICHENSPTKRDFTYGTEEFMAPEIASGMNFDVSADIFGFGMIICEIITGKEPDSDFLHRIPSEHFALNEDELRDHILDGCPDELQVMALQCCDVDAAYRPNIGQCLEILEVCIVYMCVYVYVYYVCVCVST